MPETPATAEAPQVEAEDERAILTRQLIDSATARASMHRLVVVFNARALEAQSVAMLAQTIKPEGSLEEGLIAEGLREIADFLVNPTNATVLELKVDYGLGIEPVPSGVTGGMELAKDYLGSACDSLASLCQRQAELLASGDLDSALRLLNVQLDMYTSRLETWVDGYCDKVEPEVMSAFYKGALKFTRGFLHEEKLYIEDSIAAVQELREAR